MRPDSLSSAEPDRLEVKRFYPPHRSLDSLRSLGTAEERGRQIPVSAEPKAQPDAARIGILMIRRK